MYTTPQALPGSYLTPLLIRVGTLLVTPDASGKLPATVGVVVGVGSEVLCYREEVRPNCRALGH